MTEFHISPINDTLTMPAESCQVRIISNYVLHLVEYLSNLAHKKPQEILNEKLARFVSIVSPVYAQDIVDRVLEDKKIQQNIRLLNQNLAECEYELEMHWAAKICADQASYVDYPYIDCYNGIVTAETALFNNNMQALIGKSACFIGSGPMPLTALVLKSRFPELNITCIEREEEAVEIAKRVASKSGLNLNHIVEEADRVNYKNHDFIFVASMTQGKDSVFNQIACTGKAGTVIIARTVEDLRNLLYAPIDINTVPKAFQYQGKTPYNPSHVNTAIAYRL